jgi:hypothetical protein
MEITSNVPRQQPSPPRGLGNATDQTDNLSSQERHANGKPTSSLAALAPNMPCLNYVGLGNHPNSAIPRACLRSQAGRLPSHLYLARPRRNGIVPEEASKILRGAFVEDIDCCALRR